MYPSFLLLFTYACFAPYPLGSESEAPKELKAVLQSGIPFRFVAEGRLQSRKQNGTKQNAASLLYLRYRAALLFWKAEGLLRSTPTGGSTALPKVSRSLSLREGLLSMRLAKKESLLNFHVM